MYILPLKYIQNQLILIDISASGYDELPCSQMILVQRTTRKPECDTQGNQFEGIRELSIQPELEWLLFQGEENLQL